MESFVRNFVRSSLVWLGFGVLLGLWMSIEPRAVVYRAAHLHANLLGFVSMMIFGVAYHILPRFAGTPLRSRRLAWVHLFLANGGLGLMVAGWMLRAGGTAAGTIVLAAGGVLSAAGAFLFIGNIWRTLDTPSRAPVVVQRPPTQHMQVKS
jgi:cbb3-type cytochrome oxidase subunit 1